VARAWTEFYAQPPHRVANLVMAAVAYLLDASHQAGTAAQAALVQASGSDEVPDSSAAVQDDSATARNDGAMGGPTGQIAEYAME
jgi:phosphorylase kinase alpha/beta subunit